METLKKVKRCKLFDGNHTTQKQYEAIMMNLMNFKSK